MRPFAAVRPSGEKAPQVIALPYDVMNREEAAEMAAGNPCSFLHVTRAEIDLPQEDAYSPAVYEKGRDNLESLVRQGVLCADQHPSFYIYRQEMDGREQTGVVGCVSIDEYENGQIKKHELTRIEKEQDRIRHFDTCNANTEPVFLTYRQNETLQRLITQCTENREPAYDFHTGDGIGHTLWAVSSPEMVVAIQEAFAEVPALYIADGHHRSASAYEVGKRRRQQHPDYTGEEEFNYFMAVAFPDCDLKIFDYNRVVRDLAGNTREAFLEKVCRAGFALEEKGTEIYRPQEPREFSMYLDGVWYSLKAQAEIIPDDVIGALDVSILQNSLLEPVLGIKDPRTDDRIDFVGGIRGLGELKRRADSDMKLAFAVYPVTMEELMHIADCGEIMPPKSTWFEPKLGSGLFIHRL
jgi:uncharacterized protein (DUF1015 family)